MEQKDPIRTLFIIVNAGHADEIIEIARNEGAGGATILHARGECARHEVFMGITVDEEKEMILCLTDARTAEKVMASVKEKAGFQTAAHAVCFTMPVDKMIGITTNRPPHCRLKRPPTP